MLESILSFKNVRRKPFLMFIWAFIVCFIAFFISFFLKLANVDGGFLTVIFTIIPSVFFITYLIRKEEEMDEKAVKRHLKIDFWGRHSEDILILLLFFFGLTAAFSFTYHCVPLFSEMANSDINSEEFYGTQVSTINGIITLSGKVTGMESTEKTDFMQMIFTNNMNVMLFSFFFSFIFGAGAVFILAWNASVLGVRIGQLSESAWHIPIKALPYLPHGILEIGGYLCAGLAGGILSSVFIRKNNVKILKYVVIDSAKIMMLGVALIFLGAVVEVYL